MKINIVNEYNADGHLIYIEDYPGAFVRGKNFWECISKIPNEINKYSLWSGMDTGDYPLVIKNAQRKLSSLNIRDADSDIIFESEKEPITAHEYERLKALTLKSAQDFLTLYSSVPDKDATSILPRETFYGKRPLTAKEMYEHTKGVNNYYFAEIGIDATNKSDIYNCRLNGFKELENKSDFLKNEVFDGSYGEQWSLRKLFRRFIWHDRIHAKAMYRMAVKLFGETISNPFQF